MSRSPRWSLVVAILGSTMAFVDGTVVNVALPIMQRALEATIAEMQWVVEAYAVVLAALVLVAGALGDLLGRRRVFVAGVAIFSLASVACGIAPSALALIAARSLQGVGGALLVPGSLALITAAYDEDARGGAIGTWSSVSAMTSALGPVLGGFLVAHASWRWLFVINLPIGVLTIVLSLRHVAETKDESASGHIDVVGAALAVVGLGAIVLALVEAPRLGGMASARVLGCLALGVGALVAFAVVESRSRSPMVPLELFRSRTFLGANALTLLLYAALGGAFFFLPFDLVQVQHYSPTAAGAALLPLVVLISAMSPWMGKLATRYGARTLLVVGPTLAGAGFALLARPGIGGPYWTTFFPGIFVLGVGMGLTVAPLTTAVMTASTTRHAGAASGVNNAVARAAAVLAIAVLGSILLSAFGSAVDASHIDDATHAFLDAHRADLAAIDLRAVDDATRTRAVVEEAFVSGFRTVMVVCAILAVGGAALAAVLVEKRSEEGTA